MLPQYNHTLLTSFYLWLDYKICNDQQAFINQTGLLFPQIDPSVSTLFSYASPYKSWIYDSCVSGAIVPSGFYNLQGQFLTRNSGISIDFINGRVLSNTDLQGKLSGTYSTHEINLYQSTENEVNFWMENVYNQNQDLTYIQTGNVPYRFYAPCVIITNSQDHNDPWALGGIDETWNTIRLYVITKGNYLQEAVGSYIRDLSRRYIPLANYGDAPIANNGDLKNATYCYENDIYNKYGCTGGCYIENVHNYKLSERFNKNQGYSISIMEVELSKVRVPGTV